MACTVQVFIGQRVWQRGLPKKKEREKLFFRPGNLAFCDGGGAKVLYTDCLFFLWGMERVTVGLLIGVDQKSPNWLVKITFLEGAETSNRSGIKCWFGYLGLLHK